MITVGKLCMSATDTARRSESPWLASVTCHLPAPAHWHGASYDAAAAMPVPGQWKPVNSPAVRVSTGLATLAESGPEPPLTACLTAMMADSPGPSQRHCQPVPVSGSLWRAGDGHRGRGGGHWHLRALVLCQCSIVALAVGPQSMAPPGHTSLSQCCTVRYCGGSQVQWARPPLSQRPESGPASSPSPSHSGSHLKPGNACR